MFKDLRQNAPLYVLYRGEKPRLETGSILSVGQPVPKMLTNYNALYPQQPEMVVDVCVKIGSETITFEKLPASSVIADFASTGNATNNIVISSSKDAIRTEVETMLTQSKNIVDSVSYHQGVVQECEEMLKGLNPSFAKDKEQEKTIKDLQDKIAGLESKLSGIDDIKALLLAQNNNNSKTNNNGTTKNNNHN